MHLFQRRSLMRPALLYVCCPVGAPLLCRQWGQGQSESNVTILLLEDQGLIAIDIVDALEAQGSSVAAFSSVHEADLWLRDHRPTAAIVDCILNDGDCSHLVRQLKQSGVPVIVYTGRDPAELSLDFADLDVFTKPTPTPDLLKAINEKIAFNLA